MLAKMARSAPSAAVRSVNGDDSRPRRQPGLPKRGENAKIRGGSEFIRRIPDNGSFANLSDEGQRQATLALAALSY